MRAASASCSHSEYCRQKNPPIPNKQVRHLQQHFQPHYSGRRKWRPPEARPGSLWPAGGSGQSCSTRTQRGPMMVHPCAHIMSRQLTKTAQKIQVDCARLTFRGHRAGPHCVCRRPRPRRRSCRGTGTGSTCWPACHGSSSRPRRSLLQCCPPAWRTWARDTRRKTTRHKMTQDDTRWHKTRQDKTRDTRGHKTRQETQDASVSTAPLGAV